MISRDPQYQFQDGPPLTVPGARIPLTPHGERQLKEQIAAMERNGLALEAPATISESLCRVLQLVDSCHRLIEGLNGDAGPTPDQVPRLGIGEATNTLGKRVLELEQRLQALTRHLGLL